MTHKGKDTSLLIEKTHSNLQSCPDEFDAIYLDFSKVYTYLTASQALMKWMLSILIFTKHLTVSQVLALLIMISCGFGLIAI